MKIKFNPIWKIQNCGVGISWGWRHYNVKEDYEYNNITIGLGFCLIIFEFKIKEQP
jgi:hypothetical protein